MTAPDQVGTFTISLSSEGHPDAGFTWIHILPEGTFSLRDGRGPLRADDAEAIMALSRQIAGRREIPVDYDHQIDHAPKNGQPAPAAGWIKGLQARADGIWGMVEWTGRAAAHLAAREYRYLSPVIRHDRDGRVLAILRASLVNNPALDQLTALASMETRMEDPNTADLDALRKVLDLAPTADMAAIVGAVTQMVILKTPATLASASPDPAQYVPIGDFLRVTQELNRVHQGVEAHAAKLHVEDQIRAGRLLPFMKDWGVSLCTVNKQAFDDFMSKTGVNLQRTLGPGGASALPPPNRGSQAGDLTDTDAHVAKVLGHSSDQFNKAGQA